MANLGNGKHRQICEIGEQVERDDDDCAKDQNSWKILLRLLHFPAHEAYIGPTVIYPEHGHERQSEWDSRKASRRNDRSKMPARFRKADCQRENDDENE